LLLPWKAHEAHLQQVTPPTHQSIASDLRAAYDGSAEARHCSERAPWQLAEREMFLQRLRREGRTSLLEIGAGAGHDSQFFSGHGLRVVATDLSPRMVEMCRSRGLTAHVMDVLDLALPGPGFESAYSMNSLLHITNSDLERALRSIRSALQPGALCYLGLYGGEEPFEGILDSDWHEPRRFFSFRTDEQILAAAGRVFEIEGFHTVDEFRHYQSLLLRVGIKD
jgi:SAM-dependent methyltransferase